jgi:hypothetical protein
VFVVLPQVPSVLIVKEVVLSLLELFGMRTFAGVIGQLDGRSKDWGFEDAGRWCQGNME